MTLRITLGILLTATLAACGGGGGGASTDTTPEPGAPLESPVPVSLLDNAVSDATGRVAITLQLPGHVDEVLVKATLGDTQGQRAVAVAAGTATVALTLAR